MAISIPMIWGFDTGGQPKAEASVVGAHAVMNSVVTHPNYPIQVQCLVLTTGTQSSWLSNVFTVAGTRFAFGFWVYINNANMGIGASQKIISIYTDGGTNPDVEILHTSNFPSAGFDWDLVDATGANPASVTDPFPEDTWVWCNLYYTRHNTTGDAALFVHNAYPSTSKVAAMTMSSRDTEGAGAGTSSQVLLAGHNTTPSGGAMTIRIGGAYFMDGISLGGSSSEVLNHQEFHSLRSEKASATPDVEWDGTAPEGEDDLDLNTWDKTGDNNAATYVQYNAGSDKGGAVQTTDYDLATAILSGDYNVGKFIYSLQRQRFGLMRYVYGYYDVSTGTYSVANAASPGAGNAHIFEHVVYAGDAQWPVMSNAPADRAIPVGGFKNDSVAKYAQCREMSFLKMWPKGAPGAAGSFPLINGPLVSTRVSGGLVH